MSAAEANPRRAARKRRIALWLIAWCAIVAVALGLVARFAVLTDAGRGFVSDRLQGLALGRVGRLHVEGLGGDLWSDFTIRRLTIADADGVWLDADSVAISWRPLELFGRRAHLTSATARVRIDRAPVLSAAGPAGQAPVAVTVDRLAIELATAPAASVRPGLFAVAGRIDAERNGAIAGALEALSRLHAGDGLNARFDIGVRQRLAVDAAAHEANGGAIAGLLGLPADQPLQARAHVGGVGGAGTLEVAAETGSRTIASASGAWKRAGGQAGGWIALDASRLTAPLAHALGPRVRFEAASRRAGADVYGVALTASAENASLRAVGAADPARWAAVMHGLNVQAEVADMGRLVAEPAMGRAAFNGALTGDWADLHLVGKATLQSLNVGAYRLLQVAGPIDLAHAKGDWRLRANVSGQGGQGTGVIAGLIGPAPQASLDASRLADGRTLIRSLAVRGAAATVSASGQRGLLGGLSFKGQAQITRLAAVWPGARGSLEGSWSASEGRGPTGWSFTVDARGRGAATGQDQLDRLLGAAPTLRGQGTFQQGKFSLNRADLTGAAAQAHAAGEIGLDGGLKLALGWSSHGPFEVGPIEIAGNASGSGALTGSFGAPKLDLISDLAAISLPELTLRAAHVTLSFLGAPGGATAAVAVTAGSDYGPARARTDLRFIPSGVQLSGIDAAGGGVSVAGSLTLTRLAPSLADLTLVAGPGAVLAAGHAEAHIAIADAPGGPVLRLAAKGQNAALRDVPLVAQAVTLNASGPLSRASYTIAGDGSWAGTPLALDGRGVAGETAQGYAATFEGEGKLRKVAFRTLSAANLAFGGPQTSVTAALAIGAGRADIDLRAVEHRLTGSAKLTGIDVAVLNGDYAGRIDATANLQGQDRTLGGDLTAHLTGARLVDEPAKLGLDGDLQAVLSGERIQLTASARDAAGGRATTTLSLPAAASAAPFRIAIAQTQPMNGQFAVSGEVEPLWDVLFGGGGRTIGGQVQAGGQISGTLNDPLVSGQASLAGGRFEDSSTGLKLRNVTAAATFAGRQMRLATFEGADAGAGRITGQGTLDLAKGGQSDLTLMLHGFTLIDNETATASASGPVTLSRDASGKAKLVGQLTIDRAQIAAQMTRAPPGIVRMDVIEKNRPAALDTGLAANASPATLVVALDIALKSNAGVLVKGLGLNAEMSLNAHVGGDTSRPLLSGVAHIVRGDYQFAGQRFQIDSRGVVYLASSADDIRLDLSATRADPSLTAVINIRGTAAKPVITLSSTPSLPNDEILAQVLFGRSAAQLSPVEAAELAAAVTSLATGGGFDVMGGLQNFARLDRLAIGGDAASGVTVSGGKYIGKNVYLELTGGGRAGPSASVEVRAGHGLSVLSQVGGQAGEKIAIRWRHDYGAAQTTR